MIGSVLGRLVWPGCRDESSIYRSSGVADTGGQLSENARDAARSKNIIKTPLPEMELGGPLLLLRG